MLMESAPRELQAIDEARACIPFDALRSSVINHPNTEPICQRNSGSSCAGCCRVFEWLVCENNEALTHLPCVCAAPTEPPTARPTLPPSPSPTKSPTQAPTTSSPTALPSPQPSLPPTNEPTSIPTTTPTNDPSVAPSSAPITALSTSLPSSSPSSFVATILPSNSPTLSLFSEPSVLPTASPSITPTVKPTPIPTILTVTTPPIAPTEVEMAFITNDVVINDGQISKSSTCAVPPLATVVNTTYSYTYNLHTDQQDGVNKWNEKIHRFMAARFLSCSGVPTDGELWYYESPPHVASQSDDCTSIPADAEVTPFCRVWTATETIGTTNPSRRRHLQQQSSRDLAETMNQFIEQAMTQNLFPNDGSSQLVYLDGPDFIENPISTNPPSVVDTSPPTPPSGVLTPTNQINRGNPSIATNDGDGLSNGGIAALGVLAALVVLGLGLAIMSRRSQDRGYKLEDIDYDDQELLYPSPPPVATQEMEDEEDEFVVQPQHDPVKDLPSPTAVKTRGLPITVTPERIIEDGDQGEGLDMPREVVYGMEVKEDVYTSQSPGKRSLRSPLSSMDELDRALGGRAYDIQTFSPDTDTISKRRPAASTDIIDL